MLSAFTPLATFERTCRDVGLVPIPEVTHDADLFHTPHARHRQV
jgi:hypothetical protein